MLNSFFTNSVKKVSNKSEITPSPPAASQINEAQSSGASPTWPTGVQTHSKSWILQASLQEAFAYLTFYQHFISMICTLSMINSGQS